MRGMDRFAQRGNAVQVPLPDIGPRTRAPTAAEVIQYRQYLSLC